MNILALSTMKIKQSKAIVRIVLLGALLLCGQALLLWTPGPVRAEQSYEAYYWYLGEYPADANPGWHEDANGLAHDQNNWFITQKKKLWKIPVTHDLKKVSCDDPGVACKTLRDWPKLAGYDHMGDPDYHEFDGQGYLLVPLEDDEPVDGVPPAIAVFRADTLQYIDHRPVTGQSDASWCAVDPQGTLYSSNFSSLSPLNKYTVDWGALRKSNTLKLSKPTPLSLSDESGSSVVIHDVQGGEISPDGQMLYVTAGFPPNRGDSSHGIHVLDLSTARRIQCSANPNDSGGRRNQCSTEAPGLFTFEFDESFTAQEEPEGLTIWDLDDGRAPGIRGQLHVLLVDQDLTGADEIYLKHYASTIYVDRSYGGDERGTPANPFKSVGKAYNFAWNGARINIRAGSYSETLTLSKPVKLVAKGGTVTIGK